MAKAVLENLRILTIPTWFPDRTIKLNYGRPGAGISGLPEIFQAISGRGDSG